MASYTDAISQFNPYVQQLPVELMTKVGMQKQAQYDQGVQKIQTYIDNVAGLDIYRNVDKEYLQSKLGQLGNNLKTVAAGDFSNQQLVNSVGGMVNTLGKDSIIQNAVMSTANYKKEHARMLKEYDAGKGSVQNNYDFDRQSKGWKEGTQAGEVFSGRYSNYVNYNKAWQETLDKIHPNLKAQDFPFEQFIDANGKVHTGKLAAAMSRISVEGVSSTQIQNALKATITPEIENQLRIDANYRFKDVDSEGLRNHFTVNYDSAVKQIDKRIAAIQGYSKINGNDSGLSMKVDQSVKELIDQKIKLKNDLVYNLKLSDTDPERAKTNIYKNAALSEFADGFSWEKKIEQLIDNPALQAQFERERINLTVQSQAETKRHNIKTETQADEKFLFDKEVENRKYFGALSQFTDEFGDKTEQLKTPSEIVNDKISGYASTISQNETLLKKVTGVDPDVAIKNYLNNPQKVSGENAKIINDIIEARKQKKIQEKLKTSIEDDVKKKHPEFNLDAYLGEADGGWNGMTVSTTNGQKVTYTPRELMDFTKKYAKVIERLPKTEDGSIIPGASVDAAFMGSTAKEKLLARNLVQGGASSVKTRLVGYRSAYKNYETKLKEFDNEVNAEMGRRLGDYLPQYTAVNTATPEANETYKNIVNVALSRYDFENKGVKGGTSQMSVDDAKALSAKIHSEDAGKLTYGFLNYGGEKSIVVNDGTKKYIVPISSKLAAKVPVLQQQAQTVDLGQQIGAIQVANGNYSTNPTGNFEDSHFSKNTLPNVRSLNIGADLKTQYYVEGMTPSGTQYIDMNLNLGGGKIVPLRVPGTFDASTATQFMNQINDKQIKELYLADPNISKEVKQLIKNL
jgi:hypothetical protein